MNLIGFRWRSRGETLRHCLLCGFSSIFSPFLVGFKWIFHGVGGGAFMVHRYWTLLVDCLITWGEMKGVQSLVQLELQEQSSC